MFKRLMFTVFLMLCFGKVSNAQLSPDWLDQVGSPSNANDGVLSIVRDASDNVYSTGYFSGTVDFDAGPGVSNLTSAGAYDIFIKKNDNNGNLVWVKRIGAVNNDVAFDIDLDPVNNVYLTGYFQGTAVDFDPGAGTTNLNSGGAANGGIFVLKLDLNGNYSWAVHMGGASFDQGYSLTVDNTGAVYTTGIFQGTVDFDPGAGTFNLTSSGAFNDVFVSKLSSSGAFIWAASFTGPEADAAYAIDLDGSNNVYISGNFRSTVDFDPGAGTFNLNSSGSKDIFVCKLDLGGAFQWAKKIGGTYDEDANAILVDGSSLYIAGKYQFACDFDPGAGLVYQGNNGGDDAFLCKLDLNGNYTWVKSWGSNFGDAATCISIDGLTNIYVGGFIAGTTDFNPSNAGTYNIIHAATDRDAFILKLDNSGNFDYARTIGATGEEYPYGIISNSSGDVYLGGYFEFTVDFDPGTAVNNLISLGGRDGFVVKYNPCTVLQAPTSIMGDTLVCANSTNTFYASVVLGAIGYNWFYPIGAGWTGSSNVDSIVLTSNSVGLGISVTAENSCGSSASTNLVVYIQNLPTAVGPILGTDTICSGDTTTYSASYSGFSSNYNWVYPSGWWGTNGGFTSHATAAGTSGIYTIYLNGSNACGTSPLASLDVVVMEFPTLSGSDVTICSGSQAFLEAATSVGNISWYESETTSIIVGTGINFTTPTLFSDTTYYVLANNYGCVNTPRYPIHVFVNPMPDVTVTQSFGYLSVAQAGAAYQWVDCDNSYTPISGANGSLFPLNVNGNYAVEIDLNGCIDTSTCVLIQDASINEQEANNLFVYPNPFVEKISIENFTGDLSYIEILSITGELIGSFNYFSNIDLSFLASGVYIARIYSSDYIVQHKIIKSNHN